MITNDSEVPANNWTLDQLGQFCISRHQRMAADAWTVGRAMCIAKQRCEDESHSFTTWKRTHGFTDATASRYMRLFTSFPSAEDRERLSVLGITDAMIEAGIITPRDSQSRRTDDHPHEDEVLRSQEDFPQRPSESSTSGDGNADVGEQEAPMRSRPVAKTTAPVIPDWAVVDEDNDSDEGDDGAVSGHVDLLAEVHSRSETLEEECRKAVPWQVRMLKEKVEMLLGQPADQLHQAWPTDPNERKQIAEDINGVIRLLPALAATLEAEQRELAIAG